MEDQRPPPPDSSPCASEEASSMKRTPSSADAAKPASAGRGALEIVLKDSLRLRPPASGSGRTVRREGRSSLGAGRGGRQRRRFRSVARAFEVEAQLRACAAGLRTRGVPERTRGRLRPADNAPAGDYVPKPGRDERVR